MSENQPKLKFEEDKERTATRSPPKKSKVEQSVPKKKKLKLDADKAVEKSQHLRFGKAEITPDEASRMTKQQKRAMYAAAAARSAAHREVDQYEDDNVGTQALNEGLKSEEAASNFSKNRYARKLKKKSKLQAKKNTPTAKSSAFGSDKAQSAEATSSEGTSNCFSRWRQKQDIRQSYYAAARSGTAAQTAGGKAASNGASAARSGVEQAVEKGKTAVSTAVKGLMNGAQRIATYLNNAGYRARSGKCWHPGSLRGMVGNLTYMGVLRCGDARSELMPELQIIPQEEFEAAQRIREDRSAHAAEEAEHHVPLRTRGQALLSNNVYCGHCGARLALTTSRKWRKLSDGTLDDTLRIRYTCYGKLRKQTDCTGQTGYTMHILDEIIDKMVRQIFSRLRGIPKEQLITSRYAKETAERKNHLQALQAERDKAEKDLLALKTEILAVIKGESAFPKDTLAEMIAAQEKKHTELDTLCEEASAELERNAELMANVSQLYEELISYADLYDSASFEAKKMIVSQLIRRVEVYRGYQIHVDFNFDLAQYLENSDELAC